MIRQTLKVCAIVHFLGLLTFWATTTSAESLSLENAGNAYSLSSQLSYLLAPGHKNIDEIAQKRQNFKQHSGQSVLNLGYSAKTLWVNFKVNNQSRSDQWILEYSYYPPGIFELYQKRDDGSYL